MTGEPFIRTEEGRKNRDLFYYDKYLVYVEGPDDKVFWKIFFPEKAGRYSLLIESLGGKPALKKYKDTLYRDHNSPFIVAMDSDYDFLMSEQPKSHIKIVETHVHSIENILVKPSILVKFVQQVTRNADLEINYNNKVEKWFNDFDLKTYKLMVGDILIKVKDGELEKGLPKNCNRFLDKQCQFNEVEIEKYIAEQELEPEDIESKEIELRSKNIRPYKHIKGHFVFSSTLSFINKIRHEYKLKDWEDNGKVKDKKPKRKSTSKETFLESLFPHCETQVMKGEDPELEELKNKAKLASEHLIKGLENG